MNKKGPDIVDQYARWIVLMWILTFRTVCKPLREEFPDLESIQHAGMYTTTLCLNHLFCPFFNFLLVALSTYQIKGLLREQEKRVLERNKGYNVPRPLIVLECGSSSANCNEIFWSNMNSCTGILLLLKESLIHDRFINKSSHNKNVEALMTFKKGCSNIVKVQYITLGCMRKWYRYNSLLLLQFSIQNIPNAVIQVRWTFF